MTETRIVSCNLGASRVDIAERLLSKLEALGEVPSVRAQRSYTERDLDGFEWLLLRIRTVGLLGSMNLEQAYDRSGACVTCGAGALPVPPLLADLRAMGRKALDATAHDDQIVVTTELANSIREANLSGAEFLDVSPGLGRMPSDRFRWLHMPAAGLRSARPAASSPTTSARRGRAGHHDTHDRITELRYDQQSEMSVSRKYRGAP